MGNKQQVQINRMVEALEMIAEMPVWQEGVTLENLNAQYDEARETARLAVEQFERSEKEGARGGAEDAEAHAETLIKMIRVERKQLAPWLNGTARACCDGWTQQDTDRAVAVIKARIAALEFALKAVRHG